MLNINGWDILWTVIDLLILFLLLRKFLFRPVIAVMDKRQRMIESDIEKAQKAREDAEAVKQQYEDELADVKLAAERITDSAVERAELKSQKIISEAREDAQKIIADAHKTAERERAEALDSAKEEIAGLAVMAAARIIEKNIDEESNLVYARQLLSEVGGSDD